MYGSVLKDNHACDACIKGNGPYSAYVALNDMSPGCANCHYAGTANKCSLIWISHTCAPHHDGGHTHCPAQCIRQDNGT
ncbi:hypothetical protein HDV62DRAFT_357341 [Trichoderma sp. SZMC 28011]